MLINLTSFEIDSLEQSYNLTDGHAFRRWLATEEAIVDQSAQLFKSTNRQLQKTRLNGNTFGIFRDWPRNPETKTP
jgi:hypothetical protein